MEVPQTSSYLLSAARVLGWEPLLVHVFQETRLEPWGPPAQAAGGHRGSRASPRVYRAGETPLAGGGRGWRPGASCEADMGVGDGGCGRCPSHVACDFHGPSLPWLSVPLASAPGWAALPGVCVSF